jgi:hypothetical protein
MIDVNEYIYAALREKGVSHVFKHRMSSAGRCVRAQFYHATDVPASNEREWRSLLALARGQDMEDLALELLRLGGAPIHGEQSELSIEHPLLPTPITGHPDCLWGEDGGLDVKGTNSSGWGWIKGHGAHESNIDQCQMYMHSTERKWWVLLYVNRDGYPRDEFPFMPIVVLYDPDAYEAALSRFVTVEQARQSGKAPPRPYAKPKEFPCSFCDWADHCWGEFVDDYEKRGSDEVDLSGRDLVLEMAGLRHVDITAQIKALEAELKPVRAEIGRALEQHGVKKARCGQVAFSSWLQERVSRNWKLLDEETLQGITTVNKSEQLRVKKVEDD